MLIFPYMGAKQVGAGIQLPPNAVRIMDHFELMPKIIETGAVEVPSWRLMKYSDGEQIVARPGASWLRRHFGQTW